MSRVKNYTLRFVIRCN